MSKRALQIITVFSLLCIFAYGQQLKTGTPFEPFTASAEIELSVKGAPSGIARLYGVYGNQSIIEDSAMADSTGKVVFKNPKRYPAGLYYGVYLDNSIVTFLLDRNQKIFLHADKTDIVNSMKTNSAENEIYYSNLFYETGLAARETGIKNSMSVFSPDSKEHIVLSDSLTKLILEKEQVVKGYKEKYPDSFFAAFKTMGQNPRLRDIRKPNGDLDLNAQTIMFRDEFWNNFDFNDERILSTPVYFNKLNRYLSQLFPQQVDSMMKGVKFILAKVDKGHKELFNFTVNYLLLTYKESSIMGGEKIFCYTVDNYFTLKKAYWTDSVNVIRARQQSDMMKPSLLGETGQDLNCKNDKGVYVSLYSIKKPIRIVYLYNPDCEHCQKETPKLKALYDKWKTKGLEVYAVNVEKDYDKWHKYIKALSLDWINVIDPNFESKYFRKYHVSDTPGLYVLDATNKIVAKKVMADFLEQVFEMMVDKGN